MRTWVQSPIPTWWLTIRVCDSSSSESTPIFWWSHKHWLSQSALSYMQTKHSHIVIKKQSLNNNNNNGDDTSSYLELRIVPCHLYTLNSMHWHFYSHQKSPLLVLPMMTWSQQYHCTSSICFHDGQKCMPSSALH